MTLRNHPRSSIGATQIQSWPQIILCNQSDELCFDLSINSLRSMQSRKFKTFANLTQDCSSISSYDSGKSRNFSVSSIHSRVEGERTKPYFLSLSQWRSSENASNYIVLGPVTSVENGRGVCDLFGSKMEISCLNHQNRSKIGDGGGEAGPMRSETHFQHWLGPIN